MNSSDEAQEELQTEHEALLSFVYMSPVGLVRSDVAGKIDMMNPLASQLLMPLVGAHGIDNIFESLTSVAPELRNLVESFEAARGPVCENHRIFVTPAHERAVVLSCSIIKISANLLMTVLTDISPGRGRAARAANRIVARGDLYEREGLLVLHARRARAGGELERVGRAGDRL